MDQKTESIMVCYDDVMIGGKEGVMNRKTGISKEAVVLSIPSIPLMLTVSPEECNIIHLTISEMANNHPTKKMLSALVKGDPSSLECLEKDEATAFIKSLIRRLKFFSENADPQHIDGIESLVEKLSKTEEGSRDESCDGGDGEEVARSKKNKKPRGKKTGARAYVLESASEGEEDEVDEEEEGLNLTQHHEVTEPAGGRKSKKKVAQEQQYSSDGEASEDTDDDNVFEEDTLSMVPINSTLGMFITFHKLF